jgi:ribose transport system substrate-binding protein/inositol transport system substrate-binding protein
MPVRVVRRGVVAPSLINNIGDKQMRHPFTARKVASAIVALSATVAFSAHAADTILASVPGLTFPFFVHMMKAFKAEAAKQGLNVIESDGQVSSPKQTADIEAALTKGVKGIVISPNEVDALAPGLQQAVDAKVPVVTVDRRVAQVTGILAHIGADNVKGGEAQANLIVAQYPNGATIINLQGQSGASPAIDRNKGLHNVLDKMKDKYKIVFEQTAGFDRAKGLSVTEAALSGMAKPPEVIVAANDDMALGAMEAVKGRGLKGIAIIGFDALPEALAQVRDGGLTATIEQFPAKQCAMAVDTLAAFLKTGKAPAQKVTLLTPVAITKANLKTAERLEEVK